MHFFGRRIGLVGAVAVLALALVSCGTGELAPIEDRGTMSGAATDSAATDTVGKPLPGAENLGKPGYYAVRPGDTIMRIGLEVGQNWRDIARWNNLKNPDIIEVGQVLRVIPPLPGSASANACPCPAPSASSSTSTPAEPATTAASAATTAATAAAALNPSTTASAAASTQASLPAKVSGDDDMSWIWPVQGQVLTGFDETKNKGIDIAGKLGDAVLAAADGRVVYAGAGLRGYGNLIILKHNNTYLTAYAHNRTLLVKEDQSVQKGQKIAEIGSSDTDRVKLHFEIRRQGKPVDPIRYLPPR